MKRAYLVYATMFVLLGVGLWVTLALGGTLRAPADISGAWELQPDSPSPATQPASTGQDQVKRLVIHQSGRFLTLDGAMDRRLSLKLVGGTALGLAGPALAVMTGGGWTVTLGPADDSGRHRIDFSGPSSYSAVVARPPAAADQAGKH